MNINNQYLLMIRSKECVKPDSNFNSKLRIDLSTAIAKTNPLTEDIYVSINASEIPHSWYNISENLNNNKIRLDGTSSLILPDAQYNIWTLCKAISDFNVSTPGHIPWNILASFNTSKNKVSLLNNGADVTLSFSHEDSKGLAKALGFEATDILIPTGTFTHSQGVVNLNTIHSIVLNTSLPVVNALSTTDNDIITSLGKIPVSTTYGQILNYKSSDNLFNSKISLDSVNGFEITLNDQNGKAIDFNNVNYEISLLFEVKDKPTLDNIGVPIGGGRRSDVPTTTTTTTNPTTGIQQTITTTAPQSINVNTGMPHNTYHNIPITNLHPHPQEQMITNLTNFNNKEVKLSTKPEPKPITKTPAQSALELKLAEDKILSDKLDQKLQNALIMAELLEI